MFSWSGILGIVGALKALLDTCMSSGLDPQAAVQGLNLKVRRIQLISLCHKTCLYDTNP